MAPKFKTTKKRHTLEADTDASDSLIKEEADQQPLTPPLPTILPSNSPPLDPLKVVYPQHTQPQIQQQQPPQQQAMPHQEQLQQEQQQQQQQQYRGDPTVKNDTPPASPMPPPPPPVQKNHAASPAAEKSFYCYKASVGASTFSWETYLKIMPATPAPREAFRQANLDALPINQFQYDMKLEAKDPRNGNNWCLASVVCVEGLHLRLRFVGADKMNDLYELIDSENIRAVGSSPSDLLLAPTGFTGNIAAYPRFVEKVLTNDATVIAPREFFPPTPPRPRRNMFERGMKIEAVDIKNRDFIYPATIGAVDGDKILVVFDGWKGSFDYRCDYYSRDIFPIDWCRFTGRAIQSPNGWAAMLQGKKPTWSPSDFIYGQASSTVNGFGRRTNGKAANTQINPKKMRPGRPKKSPTKDQQTKISKEKLKPYRLSNSTPEKQPMVGEDAKLESFSPMSSPEEPSNNDLSDDAMKMDRFQCQRTVPYDEWQKKRRDEDQMPRVTYSQNGDNSVNLSDTTSMASTLSTSQRRDSTDFSEQESSTKKPKLDGTDTCISEEMQKILKSKPSRLSLWSVEDVLDVLKTESSLVKYSQTFQENEIDGKAFGLFDAKRREFLMSMGLKLGPVLKVLNLRELVGLHVDTTDIVLR